MKIFNNRFFLRVRKDFLLLFEDWWEICSIFLFYCRKNCNKIYFSILFNHFGFMQKFYWLWQGLKFFFNQEREQNIKFYILFYFRTKRFIKIFYFIKLIEKVVCFFKIAINFSFFICRFKIIAIFWLIF